MQEEVPEINPGIDRSPGQSEGGGPSRAEKPMQRFVSAVLGTSVFLRGWVDSAVLSAVLSVRLSVCHTREQRLNGSGYPNAFCTVRQIDVSSFLRPNFVFLDVSENGFVRKMQPISEAMLCDISGKRCEIWCKLVLFTNTKSHTGVRLVPKSVTLNDLERRNDRRPALSLR